MQNRCKIVYIRDVVYEKWPIFHFFVKSFLTIYIEMLDCTAPPHSVNGFLVIRVCECVRAVPPIFAHQVAHPRRQGCQREEGGGVLPKRDS